MFKSKLINLFLAAVFVLWTGSAQATPVTAVYLTMDGSGSIVAADFTSQVSSYVSALNSVFAAHPEFYGQVAIGGGVFGYDFYQFYAVTAINNASDLAALTSAISALDPGRGGIGTFATAIGDAITASANALTAYETALGANLKLLIDVTTDGANNYGSDPLAVSLFLTPSPIDAINCLGIGAGADCSFVAGSGTDYGIVSFANLGTALTNKLTTEITGVPEPGTLLLLGSGLLGLVGFGRKRLKK